MWHEKMKAIHRVLKYEIFPRQEEQFPLMWEKFFGRSAPLFVEIGFGNGEFLVEWARQHPEGNMVGFEIAMESMERAQKLIHTAQIPNVRVIREEARWGLQEFFAENSIRHVIMNFPDPWPKKRHQERRAINQAFAQILGHVLEPKGIFELVTDQKWYAEAAHVIFNESPFFTVSSIETNPPRPVQTKYERKWRRLGRDIYRLQAHKVASAAIERKILEEPMPHKIIRTPVTREQVVKLQNHQEESGSTFFIVKEIYLAPEENHYLLKTIAKDEDYMQKFFIVITPHRDGWIVKLDTVTQPYRTPAVKYSVYQVAQFLENTAGSSQQ